MTVEELKKAGILPADYVSLEERREKAAEKAATPSGNVLSLSQAEFFQRRAGDGRYTPQTATQVQESFAQYGKDYTTGTRKATPTVAPAPMPMTGKTWVTEPQRGGRSFGSQDVPQTVLQSPADAQALVNLATKDIQDIGDAATSQYFGQDGTLRFRPQETASQYMRQLNTAQKALESAQTWARENGRDAAFLQPRIDEASRLSENISDIRSAQRDFDAKSWGQAVYADSVRNMTRDELAAQTEGLNTQEALISTVERYLFEADSWWKGLSTTSDDKAPEVIARVDRRYQEITEMLRHYGYDIAYDGSYESMKAAYDAINKAVEELKTSLHSKRRSVDDAVYQHDLNDRYAGYVVRTDWAANNHDVEDQPSYYANMDDKERQIYNYLYRTEGEQSAKAYHESIKHRLVDRWETDDLEASQRFTKKHPILGSIGSVGATIGSAFEYIGDMVNYIATGHLDDNFMAKTGATARSTVSDNFDWMIGDWDAFDFVYNTTMSGVDSLVAAGVTAATGVPVGGVMLGLSAAASGTNDALERGLTNGQAFLTGVVQGVFEGFFESVSIGNLLNEVSVSGLKSFAKNLVVSMGVNASEETLTELANVVYDTVANGGLSHYALAVEDYMAQGMSEREARKKAAQDIALQIGEAGASGALMGIGFSAANSARSYVGNVQTGKTLNSKGLGDAIVAFGMTMDSGSEAHNFAAELTSKAKVTDADVGKLYGLIAEQAQNMTPQQIFEKAKAARAKTAPASSQDNIPTIPAADTAAPVAPETVAQPTKERTVIDDMVDDMEALRRQNVEGGAQYGAGATLGTNAETVSPVSNPSQIAAQTPQTAGSEMDEITEHTGIRASEEDVRVADIEIDEDQRAFDVTGNASFTSGRQAVYDESQVNAYQNDAARVYSKALSRKVYFYNGSNQNGTDSAFVGKNGAIYINVNAPATRNNIAIVLGHEYVHTLEGTEEYTAMRDAIFASETFATICAQTGMTKDEMVAQIQKQYATAGRQLTPEAAERELVAQFIAERLLQDLNTLRQFAKTGAFQQFAVRIRRFLRRLRGKLKSDADLIRIERLLQRAVKAANENPAATQSGEVRGYIGANEKDVENDSIKMQLREHLDEVNEMDPVAVIPYTPDNRRNVKAQVIEQIERNGGFRIDRMNFGIIEIDKKVIDTAAHYIHSHAEKAALFAVPKVLKRGKIISGHQKHKGHSYGSVTIAAPVIINGVRGNVAVVVHVAGKNKYHAHRILMPDGSAFVINTKNAESTGVDMSTKNGDQGPTINSASTTIIHDSSEKNNPQSKSSIPFGFSMGADTTPPTRQSRFNRASVNEQARYLMGTASAKGDREELVSVLEDFYEYIAQGAELSWESISDAAQPVVEWLTQHHESRNTVDEYAGEILKEIRAVSMRLSDVQKAEAAALFGNYGEYHKKAFGTVVFSNNALITLEQRWRDLAEVYPEYFDPNENATDMPIRLLEIVDRLRRTNTAAEEYHRNMAEVRGDLTSAVYDSYWNVSEVRTERDRYEDRVYDLKEQHRAEMREERALRERAVAEERMRGDVRVTQERQRAREREQRIKEQNRVQRERASDRQKRTEMREKIRKVVKELNTMLLKGSKERPVMKGLRKAVAAALNAVQMVDAEGYEQGLQKRLDYYDQRIYSESDPEVAAVLQKERDKVAARVDGMKKRLSDLSAAYSSIIASNDSAMKIYKHDAEMVMAKIETVVELVGDTPLRYMNMRQLEAVHDLYTMVLTTVRNANKLFKQGKAEDLQSNAERIMDEISEFSSFEVDGYSETSWPARILRNFSWNQLKPIYAFKRLGSETFMSLYRELRRGEDTVARDLKEADDFAGEIRKKYGWDAWDLKKTYKFKLEDGRTLPLTLPQMMSIYAYSKRPQAQKHIELGGFVFSDKESFKADRGVFDVTRSSRESWRVDASLLTKIAEKIREVDENCLAYVDEMQQYLSTVMGAKGNEVSRVMWGVDLFKEKHYFPLKSSHDFMFEQNTVNPAVSLKSSGMTKRTTPHASNPIVLEGFDKVWADHVTQMSNYHGYVIPIDNINKVHNYATYINVNQSQSVATVIASVFGASANDYFKKLIQDLNGGVKTEAAVTLFPRLIGNAKKTAVAASMSTVIQQPTAIVRAMAMIAPKYFVGEYNRNKHGEKWEELKRYAPIAILKEIGGIDTTSRRGTTEWLNRRHYKGVAAKTGAVLTDSYYRDDKLMAAASKADEVGWLMIWEAVKREQAKTLHMDTSSTAFLKKCGERFTEVIECTQVYDSTLSRSGLMRSKDEFIKMATAFMGEPTTSYNMLMDAVLQARRTKGAKARKHAARVIVSVYASIVLSSLAASAIYALRDDDEDEAFIDKWAEQFGKKVSSDFWVHNMIPFLRDIASIADGWDVERMDMAIIADLYSAIDSLTSDNKTTWRKIEDLAGAVGALGGIPLRNLLRTGREMYNAVRFSIDDAVPKHPGERILQGAMGDLWDNIAKDQYDRTTEAIQDGDGLPMRYKKDPTVRAIADLYEETKKEREKIEEDETLTDAERDEALSEYDLGSIIGNGDIGSKWYDNEGGYVIKDEEAVDEATRLLRQSYKVAADLLVPSEEFSAAETPEKIDLLKAMYDDIYEMTKNAFKSMPTAEAVDTVEDYLETVKETETYDPDIVNAYATVTLSDGKPLITNKDLCARYKKAVDDVFEKRMNEAKGVYTWKEDGVEHKIYTARATAEEMAFIEKRELEFARSDIATLFQKVDAATLIAELDRYSADIVRRRLL